MIDFHTHILPRMDDGSSSSAQSVEMIRCAEEQGIHRFALTPHFYPERESPEDFFLRRGASVRRLREVLREQGIQVQLLLGAETAYFPGMSRADVLPDLCIENTNALLVEMPLCPWSSSMITELKIIRNVWEIQPILAHIDRYMPQQKGHVIRDLCSSGILMQANASFFNNRMSSAMAMHMLKKQMIHVLGSDCHDMCQRKPDMGIALKRIQEKIGDRAMYFLQEMQAVILGEQI